MMDIFNMLGGMGQTQQQVSQQLGTAPQQTASAMEAALPLLLSALTRNATSSSDGAASLANALNRHDGSALDMFGQGQMPDLQDGQKILGHVFGQQQYAAANAVSKRAGIDPQMAMRILSMLAPLVLAYLSRQRQGQSQTGNAGAHSGGVDIGSILGSVLGGGGLGSVLGGMLGGSGQGSAQQGGTYQQSQGSVLRGGQVIPGLPTQQSGAQTNPMGNMGNLGGMIGTLNNVLDRDGDGNGLEELIGMFGGARRA